MQTKKRIYHCISFRLSEFKICKSSKLLVLHQSWWFVLKFEHWRYSILQIEKNPKNNCNKILPWRFRSLIFRASDFRDRKLHDQLGCQQNYKIELLLRRSYLATFKTVRDSSSFYYFLTAIIASSPSYAIVHLCIIKKCYLDARISIHSWRQVYFRTLPSITDMSNIYD